MDNQSTIETGERAGAEVIAAGPQEGGSEIGNKLDREQPFLFYRSEGRVAGREMRLPAEFRSEIWRPGILEIMPAGIPEQRFRFAFRWLLHQLHIFGNREYQVLVIRHQSGALAHYAGATGCYWRWPFMHPEDMQIGDIWTHPEYRGRGLAAFAVGTLLERLARDGRNIWYVTELENPASMAVATGAGMRLAGRGVRIKPRFLRAFDVYRIVSTPREWAAWSNLPDNGVRSNRDRGADPESAQAAGAAAAKWR